MRSHHANHPEPKHTLDVLPPELQDSLVEVLVFESMLTTAWTDADYQTCPACGKACGAGETIGTVTPHIPDIPWVCWRCMVAILLTRGSYSALDDDFPAPFGRALTRLAMARLREEADPPARPTPREARAQGRPAPDRRS